ncbi:hypothetical protein X975_07668, partial [Stegodyphus mimosarum]
MAINNARKMRVLLRRTKKKKKKKKRENAINKQTIFRKVRIFRLENEII